MNHLKTHQTNLMVPWDPIDAPLGPLNDDTKNLTETDTETFFPIPKFPKPIPRLFFRYQIFRNRYRDIFSDTKFSETETDTLKKLAKVSKPRSFETEMSISGGECDESVKYIV